MGLSPNDANHFAASELCVTSERQIISDEVKTVATTTTTAKSITWKGNNRPHGIQ